MTFDNILRQMDTCSGYFWAEEARQLYNHTIHLIPEQVAVEIGCLFGRSTSVLATVQKERGFKLYVIDNWRCEGSRAKPEFWDNMKRLKLDKTFNFIEKDSIEAAKLFTDKSVDFLHLDSDHQYDSSVNELNAWIPKMKKNGIMCFHDYMNTVFVDGIKKAVDEAAKKYNLTFMGHYNSIGTFRV